MNPAEHPTPSGRVASLHLHPPEPGDPLCSVESFVVEAGKGIMGNGRHYGRKSRATGAPSRRQVSLIEREQLAEHAAELGLESIPPGAVRSNIETFGINLAGLVNQTVCVGDAVLHLHELRTPCARMDDVCPGLRALMESGRQGVMAEVVRPGNIRVGDTIRLCQLPEEVA